MKKFHLIFTILAAVSIALVGCSMLNPDEEALVRPTASSGEADFSVYVSLGNSLTAGYQSGALYQSAQVYGYAARLAVAMGTDFEMPLIEDPGYYDAANELGHLQIVYVDGEAGLAAIPWEGGPPGFPNSGLSRPYNNLGVPGAVTWDLLYATSTTNCASGYNPHFDWILRNEQGLWTEDDDDIMTVVEQAIAMSPTFMTLWIGNNEILGAATEGSGTALVTEGEFGALYAGLLGTLKITLPETEVMVANIPSVTSTPFFTTVDWYVVDSNQDAVDGNPTTPDVIDYVGLLAMDAGPGQLASGDLVLLKILSYDSDEPADGPDLYQGMGIPDPILIAGIMAAEGVDAATATDMLPLAFPHHGEFIPGELTLVAGEVATIEASTAAFNTIIGTTAAGFDYAVADVNAFFVEVAANGIDYQGTHYTTSYPSGGLFSLDGVHPSNVGQAILVDKFIEVINETWGAELVAPGVPAVPLERDQRDVKLTSFPAGFPNLP